LVAVHSGTVAAEPVDLAATSGNAANATDEQSNRMGSILQGEPAGDGKPASDAGIASPDGNLAKALGKAGKSATRKAIAKKMAEPEIPADVRRNLCVQMVAGRYDMSVATVWRKTKSRLFPKPIKFSNGLTRWSIADLDAYDANRAASR
jgi:predicted DNA-binding transcriptional regulator AlpA